MQNDFAVGGSLKNGTSSFELIAQDVGINEIPVMRDSHLATHAIDHERLRVLDGAGAGCGITRVPERACALQPCQFVLTKNLRHQTHVLVHEKAGPRSIACDDSGALLSALWKHKQAIVRKPGSVRMTEHAEKPALVLRQNRRVGQLVRIWSVRGASHTKSSMKSCAIQRRIVYLALSADTRYSDPHLPLRDFLSLARERIEVRIVTY